MAMLLALVGCSGAPEHESGHAAQARHVEESRGPHGGRLFGADGIELELRIAEDDGPPKFLAYLYDDDGNRIDPAGSELSVVLERFADRSDTIEFIPVLQHLRGQTEVREPHSFRAKIRLRESGQEYRWEYEQVEFRVELRPEAVQRAGIVVAPAAPARIVVAVQAPGEVRINAERALPVRPRFPGVVSELPKPMGAAVDEGEVLAVVHSNESLQEYAITAPMGGTIVARTGAVGAAVGPESTLYTLADLSTVWVDFAIHPHDIGKVKTGQRVRIEATTREDYSTEATIGYVGPLLEQDTRVSYARVVLPNPEGRWQPGLYVVATVFVDEVEVPVAVPEEAIVRSKFGPAVFLADGSNFEIQPIRVGRSDGKMTEVLSGLRVGDELAVENAYLLKAELGRSEATHDH
jgi:cobalt-zinc-cadmium efflux system membrane fusion protein